MPDYWPYTIQCLEWCTSLRYTRLLGTIRARQGALLIITSALDSLYPWQIALS